MIHLQLSWKSNPVNRYWQFVISTQFGHAWPGPSIILWSIYNSHGNITACKKVNVIAQVVQRYWQLTNFRICSACLAIPRPVSDLDYFCDLSEYLCTFKKSGIRLIYIYIYIYILLGEIFKFKESFNLIYI